jgi:hypothetical protein
VRQRENHARLVCLLQRAEKIGLTRIAYDKETGEIVLIVFDTLLQHFQSIEFGGGNITDGSPSLTVVILDVFCRTGGVDAFHDLDVRMIIEKITALHQSDRM